MDLAYSDAAIALLAEFNGVTPDAMRMGHPNASNRYMHDWIELAAKARGMGLKVIHDRRMLSPTAVRQLIDLKPIFDLNA